VEITAIVAPGTPQGTCSAIAAVAALGIAAAVHAQPACYTCTGLAVLQPGTSSSIHRLPACTHESLHIPELKLIRLHEKATPWMRQYTQIPCQHCSPRVGFKPAPAACTQPQLLLFLHCSSCFLSPSPLLPLCCVRCAIMILHLLLSRAHASCSSILHHPKLVGVATCAAQMSLGAGEEVRFYLNLLKNNWLGPKYDLPKIPGPPGYWGAGEVVVLAGGCCCSSQAHWPRSRCTTSVLGSR
jgi:hypothetical protein